MDKCGANRPKWKEVDQNGLNGLKWAKVERSRLNKPKWTEMGCMDQNRLKWTTLADTWSSNTKWRFKVGRDQYLRYLLCCLLRNKPWMISWAWDPSNLEVVRHAWSSTVLSSTTFMLMRKIHNTRKVLRKWNKELFEWCQSRISEITKMLDACQRVDQQLQIWILKPTCKWSLMKVEGYEIVAWGGG